MSSPAGPDGETTVSSPAGPDGEIGTVTPPAGRPRRRTRTTWLVGAGVTCLVVVAAVLGVRMWDLDGQVSDLTEDNESLAADNASLDGKVSELTAERDAIREFFPITPETLSGAQLEGTYEFLLVPVEGQCTYADCDQIGPTRHSLSIERTSDGYALAVEGGPPAPMSQDGTVHSASGVLPESMWGSCDGTPYETSFEMHLAVAKAGLAGSDLRAVEASGTYRDSVPFTGSACAPAEITMDFTARRTG